MLYMKCKDTEIYRHLIMIPALSLAETFITQTCPRTIVTSLLFTAVHCDVCRRVFPEQRWYIHPDMGNIILHRALPNLKKNIYFARSLRMQHGVLKSRWVSLAASWSRRRVENNHLLLKFILTFWPSVSRLWDNTNSPSQELQIKSKIRKHLWQLTYLPALFALYRHFIYNHFSYTLTDTILTHNRMS